MSAPSRTGRPTATPDTSGAATSSTGPAASAGGRSADPPAAPGSANPAVTTAERIADLRSRREQARQPGSARLARRLVALGRMTARDRIEHLLDEGSFVETDRLARHRARHYGIEADRPYGDAVVTGYGTVDGRPVCVYAQDGSTLSGSVGEVFGEKVGKLLELAVQTGCPVVGINDSSGARLQEGVLALAAYGRVARRVVGASGVIPQLSLIMGVCAGGAVYTAAATDFVVMVERTAHMFVTGPAVIRAVTGEDIGLEELGGARVHTERTGNAHYLATDEQDAIDYVRELLGYLPSNNLDEPPALPVVSDPEVTGADLVLDRIIPDAPERGYDMRAVITHLVDDGELLEVHDRFARNLLCGFARVDGRTVGVVANNPQWLAGALDIDASEKGARFVRFCDAFSVPLLTLVDVPGFLPGAAQEHHGIIRRGAKLGFSYIEATVPKVTVIVRKAFGGGYAVMGAKELGADLCAAWPTAQIGVMGAASGVGLLCPRELAEADGTGRQALYEEYEQRLVSPYIAAERGSVDDVIVPSETRVWVQRAFRTLRTKRVVSPPRKHSNIPL
ncbi:acyl-CoA carboxylase subunit beta [Salinispora oceanensis]|uniref:acyl-CoA carboxylase subunit beta n=1 Tax=Salinispora oceanensis TaxID=1050199 RepID=UPI00036C90D6|nr:acyl-CoA carboxylase subunit beta [Salinispora oceanensis]